MATNKEEQNKRTGLIVSIGLHAAFLLLCFFLLAWQPPDPPLPEYGIELNFGLDAAGSGDVQSMAPAANTDNQEDARPEPPSAGEEAPSESAPEPVTETTPAEAPAAEPMTDPTPEPVETPVTAPAEESPVVVKETPKPKPKPQPEVKETKPAEEPKPKPAEPKPQPKPRALYPGTEASNTSNTSGANGKSGTSDQAQANNNGDRAGATGDQGSPEGKPEAKALYGTAGGGSGGASLSMSGWTWDGSPNFDNLPKEEGRIRFKITVNDLGEVENVEAVEKTVSPSIVTAYRNVIMRQALRKTDNSPAAPLSTGYVTIVIRSR
ncbi:hypothetical protein SAMN05421823_11219 [Catalinimonas alkaloidigena]|uniref:Protein TonB, links inner and outer membranes n=1 Tax=Catalinimonas alkaloidigena TaxID=1075417 RepID=A0A1G9S462_9BACT|nr:hypothetical protein [Catalinimonas alkaloidigena]SDM30097.1 hypothetical protein SAMN05421823_11219 [Catalinimonas alkaloidigena]